MIILKYFFFENKLRIFKMAVGDTGESGPEEGKPLWDITSSVKEDLEKRRGQERSSWIDICVKLIFGILLFATVLITGTIQYISFVLVTHTMTQVIGYEYYE